MAHSLINVREFLTRDTSSSPMAIESVLGDSYLVDHNSVFRNVRTSALQEGFVFTTDTQDTLWSAYQVMSLACLDDLLRLRTFPCYANKHVLERLANDASSTLSFPISFLLLTITPNNHFHEAAHALGYRAFTQQDGLLQSLATKAAEQRVWGALITEAVANTVEFMAWMVSESPIERIFLRLNAPSSYEDADLRAFNRYVISTCGVQFVFARIFLSFLVARVYPDVISPQRQADLIQVFSEDRDSSQQELQLSTILLRTAKGLRGEFRDIIAPSYFQILGLEEEYNDIAHRNITFARHGHHLREYAERCCDLISPI